MGDIEQLRLSLFHAGYVLEGNYARSPYTNERYLVPSEGSIPRKVAVVCGLEALRTCPPASHPQPQQRL